MTHDDEDAHYEGYLLFNDIRRLTPKTDVKDVLDAFEQYPQDVENNEFKQIFLPPRALEEPLPREFFRAMDEDYSWFKYLRRDFQTQEALDEDGDLITVRIPSERTCDVFLTSDGYLFTRGSLSDARHFTNKVIPYLEEFGYIKSQEKVEFHYDFLIWLIYQMQSQESYQNEINIEHLTDAKVTGANDAYGGINRVSGSQNIAQSAPVLTGILAGGQVTMLGGIFSIGDVSLRADIESKGRIHIKATQDITSLESSGRVIVALEFAQRMCSMYDSWIQSDVLNKYPPVEFFDEIHQNLKVAGVGVDFSIEETLQYYRSKRGE